jgi:hypothetical protein
MSQSDFYVYLYFRLDGTPCYVGKGKGARWLHRGKWGRNKHFLNLCAQAKAIGKDLPGVKIAENITDSDALELEKILISAIGRVANGGPLVNLTDGGDGASGYRYTAAQREAHGARRRGRKHHPEWRAAISAAMKGRKLSSEHRAALSASKRGLKIEFGWWSTEEGRAKQRANNHGRGHKIHSEETKAKIRLARSGQTNFGGQFQKGNQPSPEIRAKLSAAVTASWARRDAARLSQEGAL